MDSFNVKTSSDVKISNTRTKYQELPFDIYRLIVSYFDLDIIRYTRCDKKHRLLIKDKIFLNLFKNRYLSEDPNVEVPENMFKELNENLNLKDICIKGYEKLLLGYLNSDKDIQLAPNQDNINNILLAIKYNRVLIIETLVNHDKIKSLIDTMKNYNIFLLNINFYHTLLTGFLVPSIIMNKIDIVRFITHKFIEDGYDCKNNMAIILAVKYNKLELVKYLYENNFGINVKGKAMKLAMTNNNEEIIKYFKSMNIEEDLSNEQDLFLESFVLKFIESNISSLDNFKDPLGLYTKENNITH